MLTQNQVDEFNENGCLIIKSFYDVTNEIEPIQYGIYQIISLLIEREGLKIPRVEFSSETFDSGFMELVAHDRSLGSTVYDAIKQIPAFVRLVSSEKHEALFKQLFSTKIPGIGSGGQGIRIDIPYEEQYRAPWHQEYLNQMRSREGLVFWSPLLKMKKEMGPVEFCLGSHKEGVFPVRMEDLNNPKKKGAYAMIIDQEQEIISRFPRVSPLSEPSDMVLVDWHTLHRSGVNSSNRCRWSLQMRHFNFDEQIGLSNNWIGSFAEGIDIATVHPELII